MTLIDKFPLPPHLNLRRQALLSWLLTRPNMAYGIKNLSVFNVNWRHTFRIYKTQKHGYCEKYLCACVIECRCYQQTYQAWTDADISTGDLNYLIGFNMELANMNNAQIKTDANA